MIQENHYFKCPRYRINTTITDIYEIVENQKIYKYSSCSLQNTSSKYKCNGMEASDMPCMYISNNK